MAQIVVMSPYKTTVRLSYIVDTMAADVRRTQHEEKGQGSEAVVQEYPGLSTSKLSSEALLNVFWCII